MSRYSETDFVGCQSPRPLFFKVNSYLSYMKILLKESQYIKLLREYTEDTELNSIEDFEHIISDDGEFKDILSDDMVQDEYKDKIRTTLNALREIIYSTNDSGVSNVEKTFKIINLINKLRRIKRFLNVPIYINLYRNQTSQNEYLQARASQKKDGKKKWINVYVGSVNEFPEGIKSIEAKKKGTTLLRKKLEPIFKI